MDKAIIEAALKEVEAKIVAIRAELAKEAPAA